MNDKDRARCDKDYIKCLSRVAYNLLQGNHPNPYKLTKNDIENNGTIRKKTIRLLRESRRLSYGGYIHSRYSHKEAYNFKAQFERDSQKLAVKPEFNETPTEVINAWNSINKYSNIGTSLAEIDNIGFIDINALSPAGILYVYYHQDEYLFKEIKRTSTYFTEPNVHISCFPKENIKKRKIAIIKGIFKKWAEPIFMPWLAKKFNLDLQGFDTYTDFKDEGIINQNLIYQDRISIKFRNYMRFPVTFQEQCFNNVKGYKKEYISRKDWLKEKTGTYQKLVTNIKDYGMDKLKEEFVSYAQEYLLSEAPIKILEEETAGAGAYLLKNAKLMTVKNMFGGSDESEG